MATRKRTRRKDDPERVKNWESHKEQVKELKEATRRKKDCGFRHAAGYVDRGRSHQVSKEQALHPLSRVLLINPWIPAIRPILDAHLREIIIDSTNTN